MSKHTPWTQEQAEKWADEWMAIPLKGADACIPADEMFRGAFLMGLAKAAEMIEAEHTEVLVKRDNHIGELQDIITEKDAEIAELRAKVERLKRERAKYEADCKRIEYFDDLHEKAATQERVIEKLIEQRNVYHTIAAEWGATETPFETLEAQIAAIEKGEA